MRCQHELVSNGAHPVPAARCLALVMSFLHLLRRGAASPKQVHQFLEVMQWFDLLRRCKLSVYDKVYAFVRDADDACIRKIPVEVLAELSLGLLLGVFWRIDLQRTYLPLLSAIDASTEFGFGASVARLPMSMARRLARVAEKQGDYVVMDGGL